MRWIRERKTTVVATLAILVLFAACKGDSPTAPPPGGGGGTVPPQGVTLAVTASNTSPLVDSNVTITATANQGGSAVPNGTAVEFVASAGLLDGAAAGTIKTTTNGAATVILTSSSAGKITVQATVNNVSKSVDVTFVAAPVEPQPPNTTPTVTSITPAIGRPAGGELIKIVGTNFRPPVRVLFDTGGISPVEAFVNSVSSTLIEAVTPAVNLGASQQELVADVIIITEAGTAKETRLEQSDAFTFRNELLTPVVYAVSPTFGPMNGGTELTILGEGFQAPVQVLFGSTAGPSWVEVQAINVKYDRIIVVTPPGTSLTLGAGGYTDLKIINILSNTNVEVVRPFQYLSDISITAVGPTEGPATGGTRVTIDGSGFVGPVTVSIGGRVAQPISVSGTRVVAITDAVEIITGCADPSGPVTVSNISSGLSATAGVSFVYRVPKPIISDISPSVVTEGGSVTVTVNNVIEGVVRIKLGDRELFPSSATYFADGSADFTVAVPSNFDFPTEACSVGSVDGERETEVLVDVTYTNVENGCTNTLNDGLEVRPTGFDPNGITDCLLPPPPEATVTTPISPACADTGTITVGSSGTATITFRNDGGQELTVVPTGESGDGDSEFTIAPAGGATIAPDSTANFTVTFTPGDSGSETVTYTFTTNDPDETSVPVCVTGNSP